VLTMDWIDGRTLNEYVDFLVAGSNAAALTTLAGRWRELVALLQRSEFAHGDLQHGNVMVDQDGQLRLVDFDGVWIPQLPGSRRPPSSATRTTSTPCTTTGTAGSTPSPPWSSTPRWSR
jgi:Predicted unusual protein kinase